MGDRGRFVNRSRMDQEEGIVDFNDGGMGRGKINRRVGVGEGIIGNEFKRLPNSASTNENFDLI